MNLADDPILFDSSAAIPRPPQPRKYNDQAVLAAASHLRLTIDTERDAHDQWIRGQFDDDAYADFCELCVNPSDKVFELARDIAAPYNPAPAPYDPTALAAQIAVDAAVLVVAVAPAYELPSRHLTTSQQNAVRIRRAFNRDVMFAAGAWYGWNGKRWEPDNNRVWQCARQLSTLVASEAISWRAKAEAARAANHPVNGMKEDQNADALEKFAPKCEEPEAKEKALKELSKSCKVDIETLDAHQWLLNTQTGIVDLRDGSLRPHDPAMYLTKITSVAYNPAAGCPRFENFLIEIMCGKHHLVEFLQQWFGYCCTGSVREQKLAFHYGKGSNGKGTLIETLVSVLGSDYCGEAAPGMLMAAKDDRHSTEIVDLRGRRLVTSSETREEQALREDFIKRATGGDRLKGRFMRQDFIEFNPTHKFNVSTNHRPRILGTDHAIWRRVMLIPYNATFTNDKCDPTLPEKLKQEREGILAWLVRGAVAWYCEGKLNPPAEVIQATAEYRADQDTVGRFVTEQCEVGPGFNVLLQGNGFTSDQVLYPRYVEWAKDNGQHALSSRRFLDEIGRIVGPSFRIEAGKRPSPFGGDKRVNVTIVYGIR
jgi:putative DNA primase/helicase